MGTIPVASLTAFCFFPSRSPPFAVSSDSWHRVMGVFLPGESD